MDTLFWGLFIFGILYSVVTLIFGEILSHAFDSIFGEGLPFLQPTVLVSGLTAFGAIGILLNRYTAWQSTLILVVAIAGALVVCLLMYFLYIRPMHNTENSTGFSIQDLVGKVGEVSISIPSVGYGEVTLRIGAGLTNQIAASFDKENIPSGTTVVVINVAEDTLYVSPLTKEMLSLQEN
ncbi:protease [Paenibacillus thiaminolyticus]|uniref:protease n=1 Tax=Paenibacillus thiaminolyticus TaxID=49283 RepID=UPI003D2D56B0